MQVKFGSVKRLALPPTPPEMDVVFRVIIRQLSWVLDVHHPDYPLDLINPDVVTLISRAEGLHNILVADANHGHQEAHRPEERIYNSVFYIRSILTLQTRLALRHIDQVANEEKRNRIKQALLAFLGPSRDQPRSMVGLRVPGQSHSGNGSQGHD